MTERENMSTSTAAAAPTILCVDDEPNILSSLRRLFRPHGYRVLTADGGAAGLALLESETVDLVISDMRMPHMDGAQFLAQVRQRWPGTMRLLLTGYADIQSILDAINQGEIYRYVTKPWDENDIVLVVRHALERRALEQEKLRLEALTASQNVRDARATQPFPGRVHLLLWCHDATQAEATLATVLAAINADDGRPLGVPVTVALARARAINITAAIEREAGAPADLAQRLVVMLADALAAYARLGRDVPRSWITARLHTAQVAAVRFPDPAAPAESTPLDDDEYPTLGVVHIEDVTK